jgi:UDP-glucose 4-epimerase
MRCIVLGASGFIGINLCQSLHGRGHEVRAFGRHNHFPSALKGCEWIQGDFSDSAAVATAISGCEIVFHLVTTTTPSIANIDKISDLNSNVVSTLQLLEACLATGVRRVVFISSGGTVYGIPKQVPTSESAPTNPISAYGISKLAIEKYLNLYEHSHGLEYRVLRVANPFGPYQTGIKSQGVIATFLQRILSGRSIEIWGDGTVTRDYIFIDDVVQALVLASTHNGTGRVFNIGSGKGHTLNDIVAVIDTLLQTTTIVEHRPSRLVDVPVSVLDPTLAIQELNWHQQTAFEEGLRATITWMKTFANT